MWCNSWCERYNTDAYVCWGSDWAMGRTTDESQFDFQICIRGRDFFLLQIIQFGSVVHPSSYSMENWGRQADHSLSFSAVVKNDWPYSTTPPILYGVHKGKHCHNFFPIPAVYFSAVFVSFRAEREWGMSSVYCQNVGYIALSTSIASYVRLCVTTGTTFILPQL